MTAMPPSKRKIVLTFGCLSGLLSAAMMYATLPFLDQIGFDRAAFVGYSTAPTFWRNCEHRAPRRR